MPAAATKPYPSISVSYLQLLVEILEEMGISWGHLLQGQELSPDILGNSQARMTATQWTRLVSKAISLSGEPGLGYAYGLRMRPTVHGVLGYAAMSAATLRQAQQLTTRYARVRQAGFTFSFEQAGDSGYLVVTERQHIPAMRTFFLENILLGLAKTTAVLLGKPLQALNELEIWFDFPQPDYYVTWADQLPPIKFSQSDNLIRLPAHYLSQRPVLADPLASQQALDLCERELALAADQEGDITHRVRQLLQRQAGGGYPALEHLANQLHMSTRTLKRQLQQQGTSFILLLDEGRCRDARQLLTETRLPIQQIAQLMGYDNPANFSRAFKRWTGESPLSCRRHQDESPVP